MAQWRIGGCFCALLLSAFALPAEPLLRPSDDIMVSLEFRVRQADRIAIGTIASAKWDSATEAFIYSADIEQWMKGDSMSPTRFLAPRAVPTPAQGNDERLLLFLRTQGLETSELLDWVHLDRHAIAMGANTCWIIGAEQIMAAVHAELARPPQGIAYGHVRHPALATKSLLVGADHAILLAEAWARDSDPDVRVCAAESLMSVSGDAGKAVLIGLLNDSFAQAGGCTTAPKALRHHPVRAAAWIALDRKGIGVPRPVIAEPDDLFRSVDWTQSWMLAAAGIIGVLALRRIILGKGSWRPLALRTTNTICHLAILAGGVCLLLWVISFWRIDLVASSNGQYRTEICSAFGTLRITNIMLYNPPTAACHNGWASFRPSDGLERTWDIPATPHRFATSRWFGMHRTGYVVSSDYGMFDWSMIAVPHPLLPVIPLLLAFSLHWLTARAARIIYAWRRICWTCGYDMRATPDRCPECGTVIPGHVPTPARVMRQLQEQKREEQELRQAEEKYHDALAAALDRMTRPDEPPK